LKLKNKRILTVIIISIWGIMGSIDINPIHSKLQVENYALLNERKKE
jgi:hypothetical protein